MGYENYRQAASEARYLEGREILIIEQAADINALVAYVWQVDRAEDIVGNEAEILRCRAAIEPIIRRWVGAVPTQEGE